MEKRVLAADEQKSLEKVGFLKGKERTGSFLAADKEVIEILLGFGGVEILPMALALEKYEWLRRLMFNLVDADMDGQTRMVADQSSPLGYFIRISAGQKVMLPIQTCYLIRTDKMFQLTHNIIVAEPKSQLHLISGCILAAHVGEGKHIGVTEYYIGEGATVTSTMIHSWGPHVKVYSRSAAHAQRGGRFISTYVAMTPVKYVQMSPKVIVEPEVLAELHSVVYAPALLRFDLGGTAILRGDKATAEIISRSVSGGGSVVTRGHIIGEQNGGRGIMQCNGLLLKEGGMIHAIPELEGRAPRLQLSHEASVGMISREELDYLMASGIDEERARELIVQGFLELSASSLPPELLGAINKMIAKAKSGEAV